MAFPSAVQPLPRALSLRTVWVGPKALKSTAAKLIPGDIIIGYLRGLSGAARFDSYSFLCGARARGSPRGNPLFRNCSHDLCIRLVHCFNTIFGLRT
jgi:hypothetical protein